MAECHRALMLVDGPLSEEGPIVEIERGLRVVWRHPKSRSSLNDGHGTIVHVTRSIVEVLWDNGLTGLYGDALICRGWLAVCDPADDRIGWGAFRSLALWQTANDLPL